MASRVKQVQRQVGAASSASELVEKTRQVAKEGQEFLSKHLEPHEIVLNKHKLETIPTLVGKEGVKATRELFYTNDTQQGEIKKGQQGIWDQC